jgi:hypothetical protein
MVKSYSLMLRKKSESCSCGAKRTVRAVRYQLLMQNPSCSGQVPRRRREICPDQDKFPDSGGRFVLTGTSSPTTAGDLS